MKDIKIHSRSKEEGGAGVMIDFTWKNQRYVVISDDASDCGEATAWRYVRNVCRCGACKALWSAYEVGRRQVRKGRSDALVSKGVCPMCGNSLTTKGGSHG